MHYALQLALRNSTTIHKHDSTSFETNTLGQTPSTIKKHRKTQTLIASLINSKMRTRKKHLKERKKRNRHRLKLKRPPNQRKK